MRPGIEEHRDGSVTGIPTGRVRAAVMHGVVESRVSAHWLHLAAAGVRVLLLLATEPEETRARNGADVRRFEAAVPEPGSSGSKTPATTCWSTPDRTLPSS